MQSAFSGRPSAAQLRHLFTDPATHLSELGRVQWLALVQHQASVLQAAYGVAALAAQTWTRLATRTVLPAARRNNRLVAAPAAVISVPAVPAVPAAPAVTAVAVAAPAAVTAVESVASIDSVEPLGDVAPEATAPRRPRRPAGKGSSATPRKRAMPGGAKPTRH